MLVARANHTEHQAESARVEMSPQSWQALKARAREGHIMPHAEKARERKAEMSSAMSHLSSSSLVQRAASECAGEAQCVPTVDELVKRAAAACSKDPSCVCDWGKYPQQCFLSEVQRHKQLEKDAKALVRQINERAATDNVKKAVVSTLEHEEESFEQVLNAGRKAVGAGAFTEGKSALAKAEYLHELAMRKTGDDKGPVMQRQARSLESFAKEVVEAEAEHRARHEPRDRREAGRRAGRGRESGMSTVETQIKALSGNVEKLMYKVGTMEQKNLMKKQMTEAGVHASSNPKSEVQNLVKEIAVLTGKLGDVEHPDHAARSSPHTRPESAAVARFGAEALAHEESQFAEAIARGERAAFNNKMDNAHMALQEARYYHSEIVRLKGQPRAAPCEPCEALEKSMTRVQRNHNGGASAALKASAQGREQELVQVGDGAAAAAGQKFESTASIETNFDAALSRGEQARIKGNHEQAQHQEKRARTALHELDARELPNGDRLVKQEMGEALESFEHGVHSMPRKQLEAKREGNNLAARVKEEEKTTRGDNESRKLRNAEKQQKKGSHFVDHLLFGEKHKKHSLHEARVRGREARSHAHMLAHARLERKHQTRLVDRKSRADELREAAERDDRQSTAWGERGRQRKERPERQSRYDRSMESNSRREELRRAAAHDDRRHNYIDEARRRLHERRGQRRQEAPEREGRGWQDRREMEKREITEHEGREHLPAYRKQDWQQAPLPKSVLARIYGHFSRN